MTCFLWFSIKEGSVNAATIPIMPRVMRTSANVKAAKHPKISLNPLI